MDARTEKRAEESPLVVTVPLVLLAIPSVLIGAVTIGPVLFGGYFGDSIHVLPEHDVVAEVGAHYDGWLGFIEHAFQGPAVYLALAGLAVAWLVWGRRSELADLAAKWLAPIHWILERKYGFDEVYQAVFAGGSRRIANLLSDTGDRRVIDGWVVNGSAHLVGRCSVVIRHLQSGYLYHYGFVMIIGLLLLISAVLFG